MWSKRRIFIRGHFYNNSSSKGYQCESWASTMRLYTFDFYKEIAKSHRNSLHMLSRLPFFQKSSGRLLPLHVSCLPKRHGLCTLCNHSYTTAPRNHAEFLKIKAHATTVEKQPASPCLHAIVTFRMVFPSIRSPSTCVLPTCQSPFPVEIIR